MRLNREARLKLKRERRLRRLREKNPPQISRPEIRQPETNVIVRDKPSKAYSDIVIEKGLCSVIILTYNRPQYLAEMVKSLRDKTDMPLELIICEGGTSLDNHKAVYDIVNQAQGFRHKHIILSIDNCHSGKIINDGHSSARGEYVFLSNDDIIIKSEQWAERLIEHGKKLNQAGIIGVASNGTYCKQILPETWDCNNHVGEYGETDQVAGIFAYYPRKAWEHVGQYDENLAPRCGCDADYSIRCRAYGYKLYFAKDVYVLHKELCAKTTWEQAYQFNQKKYGVNYITFENGESCVKKAKDIYKIPVPITVRGNSDAVGVWYYRGTIIEKTLKTLVKYTPKEIPIYIMEQTAPEMKDERDRLEKAVEKYGDRIKIERCFVSRERRDAPYSILKFLELHPEIEYLLKIDDDYIVCNDIYTLCKKAYYSVENCLQSFLLTPMNIYGLHIFKERVKEYEWLDDKLLNPQFMYNILKRDNKIFHKLWESSIPPNKIEPQLKKGEQYIPIPDLPKQFSISHYFAHRNDIFEIGGLWDEPNWHKKARETNRPRIIDTWNMTYHLAWYPNTDYALKEILPLINQTEF